MAAKKPRARVKDANPRKYKKKTSPLVLESIDYVDYKNVDLLNRFVSDRAKIRNRRVTGNDVQQQRDIANAIKVAREMGLLPYARRVASASRQRPPRDGGDGGGRRPRDSGDAEATESRVAALVGAPDGVVDETDDAIVADDVITVDVEEA
jgi:small subunit ribosomal protein S18